MVKCITKNIEVSIRPFFHKAASAPELSNYVFIYEVSIKNHGDTTVQLISRQWKVTDILGELKIIRGLGVIGEQPVILPGQEFNYTSACNLNSHIGSMSGRYKFINSANKKEFYVKIPSFVLIYPPRLN